MAKFLLAWELGANYGHVARCREIGLALRRRGHEVLLAVRDTRPAAEVLGPDLPFVQAPLPIRPARLRQPPVNYAELLLGEGYAEPPVLRGLLMAWRDLLRLGNIEAVLADHAPTALLAAGLADVPALPIGNGFAIPPEVTPWPSIRSWEAVASARLEEAERRLQGVIASACAELGWSDISLRACFGANALLNTFPELDHYGDRPAGNYIGPIDANPDRSSPAPGWQTFGRNKILAYLRPRIPGFTALMAALKASDAEILAVVPGLPMAEAKQLAGPRLRIALRPLPLQRLLAGANAIVSYGGGAFTTEALLAGKPLLLLPQFVEQYLGARRIEALGAGLLLGRERDQATIALALTRLLDEASFTAAAQSFAERHATHRSADAIHRAVLALETLIAPPADAAKHLLETTS